MKPGITQLFSAIIFALGALLPTGMDSFASNLAGVISETAPLDVVLVIDASDSMTYDVEASDPMRDPSQCNPAHNCHPFEEAKNAAEAFVDQLNFPDDRVAIVTFDNDARVNLSFATDRTEVQNTIDALGVVEPDICDTASGPCREYKRDAWGNIIDLDGDGIGDQYLGFRCPIYNQTGNPSTCTTTAIGQGLLFAGNEFDNVDTFREGSRRVVILLTDGAANAPSFVCPNSTWTAPFCRDLSATSRHCLSADYTSCIAAGGVVDPDKYDADDYARDMADFVSGDQEALIYTIGLGPLVQTSVPIDSNGWGAGEQLLRYAADIGNGAYYYAPSGEQLDEIFQDIYSHLSSGPKTLVVTKVDDTDDGSCDDDCSLREAMGAATAGSTIMFDIVLSGQTIALSSTLVIDKDLTIDGSTLSPRVQISGDSDHNRTGDVSVFQITAESVVEITHLDIVNGYDAMGMYSGGINNYGELNLTNCSISGNSGMEGGAIYNNGLLTVTNCSFTDNTSPSEGGAICNDVNGTVLISNSIFSNNTAEDAGAIVNAGTLSVSGSKFIDNSVASRGGAIAIAQYGTTSVDNSTFTGNSAALYGGAILNYTGTLTVKGSTFANNSAELGGAIAAGPADYRAIDTSTVTIENSIFSENIASSSAGGLYVFAGKATITGSTLDNNRAESGGGLVNIDGVVEVINSTLYGNKSTLNPGGGMINADLSYFIGSGSLTVKNSTISDNVGGGLYNSILGSISIQNTILASNTSGMDCYNEGTLTSTTNNLIEINGDGDFACGTPISTDDPGLGPLADNGGPTWTMSLLPNSPAIDTGDNASCPATDQRGVIRPERIGCDIGAFEYQGLRTLVVTNANDNGWGSLRQAIADSLDGDTIHFKTSLARQTILLASELSIDKNISIDGSGLDTPIEISGNSAVRIFNIGNDNVVTLRSMILKNGKRVGTDYTESGAAIYTNVNSQVTIRDVSFNQNVAYQAGAIYIAPTASVSIIESKFLSNISLSVASAIYVQSRGNLSIQNSQFNGNNASSAGTIYFTGSTISEIEDSSFSNNHASSGGAIYAQMGNASITIQRNTFLNNMASDTTGGGGALYAWRTSTPSLLTIDNNTFEGNSATNKGGAILFSNSGDVMLRNNTFSDNAAHNVDGEGGGNIHLAGGSYVNLYNNIIANVAVGRDCTLAGSASTIGGHNLVEDGSLVCQPSIISDPLLDVLTDNGGPTQTMALQAGSPAINAGDDVNCLSVDQRGVARPQGSACDIGAYEYAPSPISTQSIELESGWNLVSFSLQPLDTGIATVLSSIDGAYNLVYAWDASGAHSGSGNWMKYGPTAPAYQNSLDHLDETMGFWIYMLSPETLEIMGYQPTTTNITLTDNAGGWNLVAYPSSIDGALPEALSDYGVDDDFSLVYAYHASDANDSWSYLTGRVCHT